MKFKEPTSRIPKSTRDVAQEPVGESEVKFIVHLTFQSTHFELIIQKLELPPDLKMDIDVEFDPNIMPQVEPEFVEGSSVCYCNLAIQTPQITNLRFPLSSNTFKGHPLTL